MGTVKQGSGTTFSVLSFGGNSRLHSGQIMGPESPPLETKEVAQLLWKAKIWGISLLPVHFQMSSNSVCFPVVYSSV